MVTTYVESGCLLESLLGKYEATHAYLEENLPTMVAVKQNLILQASSYSQKILKNLFLGARVWAPIPVYRCQNRPGYVAAYICIVWNVMPFVYSLCTFLL